MVELSERAGVNLPRRRASSSLVVSRRRRDRASLVPEEARRRAHTPWRRTKDALRRRVSLGFMVASRRPSSLAVTPFHHSKSPRWERHGKRRGSSSWIILLRSTYEDISQTKESSSFCYCVSLSLFFFFLVLWRCWYVSNRLRILYLSFFWDEYWIWINKSFFEIVRNNCSSFEYKFD